jgi:transposase
MANRKYSDELKERAVRLAIEQRPRPLSQVARDLGVEAESLRVWVRRAEADVGNRPGQPTSADLEELKRLRKENSQLRKANQILKDASVYFATELDPTRRR